MNNTPDTQDAADDALAERFKLMRQADSALVPAFPTQEQLETQQPVAVASAFSGAPWKMAVAASVVARETSVMWRRREPSGFSMSDAEMVPCTGHWHRPWRGPRVMPSGSRVVSMVPTDRFGSTVKVRARERAPGHGLRNGVVGSGSMTGGGTGGGPGDGSGAGTVPQEVRSRAPETARARQIDRVPDMVRRPSPRT